MHAAPQHAPRRAAHTRSRVRRGSRFRSAAVTGLILTGATVLGIAGAGGTYALLSARAETAGATVTAGTLDLRVDGQAAAALGTLPVTPATPVARAFTVTSIGDVPSRLSASVSATTAQEITANAQVRITPVTSAAACAPGLSGPLAALNGYAAPSLGRIEAGAQRTFCLEVRLNPGTPVAQSGQGIGFTMNITATQEAS
ncbi:hypothetical protein AA0Z99_11255 [Agrococcus sp. 1P02AA]|uniref:hypothetical protein n=1 Tax=Agrococcus sp. 1P02AA TaxID=3132259 RepID=UPI0039A6D93D